MATEEGSKEIETVVKDINAVSSNSETLLNLIKEILDSLDVLNQNTKKQNDIIERLNVIDEENSNIAEDLNQIMVSNSERNLKSFSKYSLKSLTCHFSMAILSTPMPKAKPEYFLLSMPEASSTFGSTMPQPIISSHPVPLHILHPLPLHILQFTSTSALGSVNGKYEGLILIFASAPNISLANRSMACFMSANDTPSSM